LLGVEPLFIRYVFLLVSVVISLFLVCITMECLIPNPNILSPPQILTQLFLPQPNSILLSYPLIFFFINTHILSPIHILFYNTPRSFIFPIISYILSLIYLIFYTILNPSYHSYSFFLSYYFYIIQLIYFHFIIKLLLLYSILSILNKL